MSLPLKILLSLVGIIFIPFVFIFLYFFFSSSEESIPYVPEDSLEISAYNQIGVVTEYDLSNGYYAGGNPPENSGVCSDVVVRALRDSYDFDLQEAIYQDIVKNPELYSDTPDKNINHRRVKNILVFLRNSQKFQELSAEISEKNIDTWKAGDIVTYKKIPGRLWHIGIVSGQKNKKGIPMLIDNHGYGTDVRISIADWKSEISGHFRYKKED